MNAGDALTAGGRSNRFYRIRKAIRQTRAATLFLFAVALCGAFGNQIARVPQPGDWVPPLLPYAATTQDAANADYKSPFDAQEIASVYYRHWLGTDQIGRDVAAGMIAGCRTALVVGIVSTLLGLVFGLGVGLAAGYWGAGTARAPLATVALWGSAAIFWCFNCFAFLQSGLSVAPVFMGLILLGSLLGAACWGASRLLRSFFPVYGRWSVVLPVDAFLMRTVEILQSIPPLLWILVLLTIVRRPSVWSLSALIAFFGWTQIARIARGETLRVRRLEYVEAAEALGVGRWGVLTRHILPNIGTPVWTGALFNFAAAILLESALSFLGLGLPPESVTWGSLLHDAQVYPGAWWMAVAPGAVIFLTILSLNQLAEKMTRTKNG